MITGLLAAAVFATLFVVTLYFKLRDHTSELYGRLREIEITNPEKDERLKDFQSWIRHENEKRQRLYNGLLSIFLCLTIVSLGSVSVISGYTSVLEKGQEVKFQRDSIACSPQAICKKLDDIEKKIQNSDSTKFASALDELWKKIDTLNASLHNVRAVSDDNTNLASGPPSTVEERSSQPWYIFWPIAVLILGGAGWFAYSIFQMLKNFSGKALIAATVSSLVTISGLTLFGIENFKGDFRFFERTNFNYPAADSVGVVSALSMQHVGDINGFETGKYDTYNEQDLNSVVTQINKDAAVTVLFVIGEVDKRELNANLKKELGSNLTLARSRAEIISAKLQEKFGTRSILTLSRGALHPGNTSIGEKEDRKVSVYAMKIGG